MEGKRATWDDESHQNSKEINCFSLDELEIIYTNADCLTNKMIDLKLFLNTLCTKPHVIAITEVNSKVLSNKMQESEFNLDGYNIFSVNVGNCDKRGIIVFVDKFLKVSEIETSVNFDEYIIIQITGIGRNNLVIGTFYRSPNSSSDNDNKLLQVFSCVTKMWIVKNYS